MIYSTISEVIADPPYVFGEGLAKISGPPQYRTSIAYAFSGPASTSRTLSAGSP
jgi:hypothetical protein